MQQVHQGLSDVVPLESAPGSDLGSKRIDFLAETLAEGIDRLGPKLRLMLGHNADNSSVSGRKF